HGPRDEPARRATKRSLHTVHGHQLLRTGSGTVCHFFLLVRPPPSSTLFPYTTLFRSLRRARRGRRVAGRRRARRPPLRSSSRRRSEEHTSELQSRGHLVCRLLLEKKKDHPQRSPPERLRPQRESPAPGGARHASAARA